MSDSVRYRVGRSWGTTIVACEDGKPDRLMGNMQTRDDAALVVGCLNAVAAVLAPTVEDLAPGKLRLRAAYLEEQLRQLTSVRDDDPIACALVAITDATSSSHTTEADDV